MQYAKFAGNNQIILINNENKIFLYQKNQKKKYEFFKEICLNNLNHINCVSCGNDRYFAIGYENSNVEIYDI